MAKESRLSKSSVIDEIVDVGEWLWPVRESIDRYHQDRPLEKTARAEGGFGWAQQIAEAESRELSEVLGYVAEHPGSHLNGARKALFEETGDTAFGWVEMLRSRHPDEYTSDELFFVSSVGRLLFQAAAYGVDVIAAGLAVNYRKNRENNPIWALRHVTGLEQRPQIEDRLTTIRLGLRKLRDNGRLSGSFLEKSLDGYGYAMAELVRRPALATAFLRQVAINGAVLG